jgi:hypothetical protein
MTAELSHPKVHQYSRFYTTAIASIEKTTLFLMAAMDELFGRDANDREELFEPENGMMMSVDAEQRIANGCIVLVPDVPNDATAIVYDQWTRAKIKNYKLRVLRPKDECMRTALPWSRTECVPVHRRRRRDLDSYWRHRASLESKASRTAMELPESRHKKFPLQVSPR